MRRVLQVGVAVATIAFAGCGGGGEETWPGPPAPGVDGTVSVNGFAAHQESVDESWETYTVLAATHFLNVGERLATNKSIEAAAAPEGSDTERVIVVFDGLLDDESVRAERWTLDFEPAGDGFRLVAATRAVRCQTGKGHDDFSTEPCEST